MKNIFSVTMSAVMQALKGDEIEVTCEITSDAETERTANEIFDTIRRWQYMRELDKDTPVSFKTIHYIYLEKELELGKSLG